MKKVSALLVLLSFIANSYAQSAISTLSVKGESKIFQMPDIMNISITISNKDIDYQSCVDGNFKQVSDFKKAVSNADIKGAELKDVGQRVNEERSYIGGKSVPNGYRATYQLIWKVPAKSKLILQSLEAMRNSGVASNYNANYQLSPELLKSIETNLMEQAVADAMQKAKILSAASNCELLKILQIKYGVPESPNSPIRYMDEALSVKSAEFGGESFTNPNLITLSDRVAIDFQIEAK